jgi:hypothetical protein
LKTPNTNTKRSYRCLRINKELLLEKYDLGYEYDENEAPKEVIAVDNKIHQVCEYISNVISTLKYESGNSESKDSNYRETLEVLLEGIQEQEMTRLLDIKI